MFRDRVTPLRASCHLLNMQTANAKAKMVHYPSPSCNRTQYNGIEIYGTLLQIDAHHQHHREYIEIGTNYEWLTVLIPQSILSQRSLIRITRNNNEKLCAHITR